MHSDTWRSVSMFSLSGTCGDCECCLNHTVGLCVLSYVLRLSSVTPFYLFFCLFVSVGVRQLFDGPLALTTTQRETRVPES